MTDDQGVTAPVVPTDDQTAADAESVFGGIASLKFEIAEKDAEIERLRAQLASRPRGRGQGNFVSARVHRHEDARDAAAIARWERETGQTWTPEPDAGPTDHVDPAIQEAADAEPVG